MGFAEELDDGICDDDYRDACENICVDAYYDYDICD